MPLVSHGPPMMQYNVLLCVLFLCVPVCVCVCAYFALLLLYAGSSSPQSAV